MTKNNVIVRVAYLVIMILVVIGLAVSFGERAKCRAEIEDRDKKIVELEEQVVKMGEEVEVRESRIEELEEEIENWKNGCKVVMPNGFKSYMGVGTLNKNSKQGKIVFNSNSYTNEDGLRIYRENGVDYYCVALGSYYGNVGDKFWVETDKGNKYRVIKADEKADKHTDPTNRFTIANGCIMEWIVEVNKLDPAVRRSGNINNVKSVSGQIITISKIVKE